MTMMPSQPREQYITMLSDDIKNLYITLHTCIRIRIAFHQFFTVEKQRVKNSNPKISMGT